MQVIRSFPVNQKDAYRAEMRRNGKQKKEKNSCFVSKKKEKAQIS